MGRERNFPGWLPGAVAIGLLSSMAILIAGYHSGIEDDSIYLPGIKKLLNPALYPHDSQFFASQTKVFLLLRVVAALARSTHLSIGWIQFLLQIVSISAVVAGCWYIAGRCFHSFWDRVGAVALASALLRMPVAGTALYIVDQHLHPRTLASAAILFAIGATLDRRRILATLFSIVALLVHPLMAAYGIAFMIVLWLPLEHWDPARLKTLLLPVRHRNLSRLGLLMTLPLPIILHPNAAWREALMTRNYLFLSRWAWYEWIGMFAPMLLLWWFGRVGKRMGSPVLTRLCERLVLYSVVMTAAGLIVGLPTQLDWLRPLQPTRYLQLVSLLMLLAGGGLLAHYLLQNRVWRWMLLFVPLCGGMLYAQCETFPSSTHFELPGRRATNRWVRCFRWVQLNTPESAYFAVDPNYTSRPDEEDFGFRAIAERSKLADNSKDAAVVALTPELAPEWKRQVDAMRGYEGFTRDNFLRLKEEFGVDWALVESNVPGLSCPYQQDGLSVCRIE